MITLTAVAARSGCSRMLSSAAPFPAATRLPQLSHAYHSCTSRTQQQLQRSLPYTLCRPVSSSGSIVRWRVQSHWSAPLTCAAVRRYSSEAGAALGRVVPTHLQVLFTCTVCSHRSAALMSKQSYTSGVVLIRCDGCKKLHLFADHLGKHMRQRSTATVVDMLYMAATAVTAVNCCDTNALTVNSLPCALSRCCAAGMMAY